MLVFVGMVSTVAMWVWDSSRDSGCGSSRFGVGWARLLMTAAVMVLIGMLSVADTDVLSSRAGTHFLWVRRMFMRVWAVNAALVARVEAVRLLPGSNVVAPLADIVLGAVGIGAILGSVVALGSKPPERSTRWGGTQDFAILRVGVQALQLLMDTQSVAAAAVGVLCVGTSTDAVACLVWATLCWLCFSLQTA